MATRIPRLLPLLAHKDFYELIDHRMNTTMEEWAQGFFTKRNVSNRHHPCGDELRTRNDTPAYSTLGCRKSQIREETTQVDITANSRKIKKKRPLIPIRMLHVA